LVGTNSARTEWFNTTVNAALIESETTDLNVFSGAQNSANTFGPWILLGKSRGSASGDFDLVADDDQIGSISFQGADGTHMVEGAKIQGFVDGTTSANEMPGRIVFSTNDGTTNATPTERLRITSDGLVGIGTDNPASKLHVNGGVSVKGPATPNINFSPLSGVLGNADISFDGNDLRIVSNSSGADVRINANSRDNDFVLKQDGDIGIGTDNPLNKLHVFGSDPQIRIEDSAGSNAQIQVDGTNSNFNLDWVSGSDRKINLINSGAGAVSVGIAITTPTSTLHVDGDVLVTGIGTAIQWDATSDVALKENIEIINEPIVKLSQLKGVTFDWKFGGHSVGVIAQDVEKVLPTAVGGSKDQKTVNYNAIIGLLVESVKDQQKQIEELKSLLDK